MSESAATIEFEVARWSSVEYGTERPCEVGRRLTWIGLEGGDTARIPEGVYPSAAMLAALASASVEEVAA